MNPLELAQKMAQKIQAAGAEIEKAATEAVEAIEAAKEPQDEVVETEVPAAPETEEVIETANIPAPVIQDETVEEVPTESEPRTFKVRLEVDSVDPAATERGEARIREALASQGATVIGVEVVAESTVRDIIVEADEDLAGRIVREDPTFSERVVVDGVEMRALAHDGDEDPGPLGAATLPAQEDADQAIVGAELDDVEVAAPVQDSVNFAIETQHGDAADIAWGIEQAVAALETQFGTLTHVRQDESATRTILAVTLAEAFEVRGNRAELHMFAGRLVAPSGHVVTCVQADMERVVSGTELPMTQAAATQLTRENLEAMDEAELEDEDNDIW